MEAPLPLKNPPAVPRFSNSRGKLARGDVGRTILLKLVLFHQRFSPLNGRGWVFCVYLNYVPLGRLQVALRGSYYRETREEKERNRGKISTSFVTH